MAISLRPVIGRAASSLSRRLSTFGLGESPSATTRVAYDRIGDCSREDCPFHPARRGGRYRFCCSRVVPHAPARDARAPDALGLSAPLRTAAPAFAGHPALCCSDFPLVLAPQRPSCRTPHVALSMRRHTSKRVRHSGLVEMVPKEGFEPSRPYGHYALNVARLPIPPLRPMEPTIGFEPMTCCLRNSCSAAELRRRSRRRDSTMRQIQAQYAVFALRSVRIFPKGTWLAHKSRMLARRCVSPTRH
jgi:hypothetical protein